MRIPQPHHQCPHSFFTLSKATSTMPFIKTLAAGITLVMLLHSTSSAQQTLHSLFDNNVIAFARFDLQQLDYEQSRKMVAEMFGETTSVHRRLRQNRSAFDAFLKGIQQTGARECYMVVSLNDLFLPGLAFYLTTPDNEATNQLVSFLQSVGLDQYPQRQDEQGVLIATSPQVMQRLQARPLPLRDDTTNVLSGHRAPVSIVFCPSPDQRRVLRELCHELPEPLELFDARMIADGARQISLYLSPGADRPVEWVVSGEDEEVSQSLALATQQFLNEVADGSRDLSVFHSFLNDSMVPVPTQLELPFQQMAQVATVQSGPTQFSIRFDRTDGSYQNLCRVLQVAASRVEATANEVNRSQSLRQCLLACHNYHDAYKSLPPRAIRSESGQALLSWRVAILPFIEQYDLYQQFRLNEPWDSEHNRKLITPMPAIFATTDDQMNQEGKTTFVMPGGKGTAGGGEPLTLEKFTDGTSNTILLMEVSPEQAVIWTQPEDWSLDPDTPLRGIFSPNQQSVRVGVADGSVRWLPRDEVLIRAMLTIGGKEFVPQRK